MRKISRSLVLGTAAVILALGASASAQEGVESFTIALGDPATFDVTRNFALNDVGIQQIFTESLERIAIDGTLSPRLAVSVEEPDETTLVYTLRGGVRFSNGNPLTAEDVVFSIERAIAEGSAAKTTVQTVAGAEKTGENEVTIHLEHADPAARGSIALSILIQEKAFAEANAETLGSPEAVPVGTGPYVIDSYRPGNIEFVRNEHFWGDAPLPERLVIVAIPEDMQRQLALRSGEIDASVIGNLADPGWNNIPGSTIYTSDSLLLSYLAFDNTVEPFNDVHVRRAIAHSLDREGLVQGALGGRATILRGLLPPLVAHSAVSQEEADAFFDSLPQYGFDLDKAREELEASRYGTDIAFTIHYRDTWEWANLLAQNIAYNLNSLGADVRIAPTPNSEYYAKIYALEPEQPTAISYGFTVPDLSILSHIVAEGVPFNLAKWQPEVVSENVPLLFDVDRRWNATKAILEAAAEDVPAVPLWSTQSGYAAGNGFAFGRAPTLFDFSNSEWLDLVEISN